MRDCSTCTVHNRTCVFGDDWESCLTCKERENGQCDGSLDLSQIVLANINLRRAEKDAMPLLERIKQDAQLLTTLSMDFKAKQGRISTSTPSRAEDLDLERLQSEIRELALTGKQVSDRHKVDRLAYEQLFRRVQESREHEKDLFHEVLSQVQRRTINDCPECRDNSKICTFLDESEQCTECQRSPRRRCQGSVNDEDTDRIKAALENVDSQIDGVLSSNLPDSILYRSLKARLEQEIDATMLHRDRSGLTSQEREDHSRLSSRMMKTRKELEKFRKQSLIDTTAYQELRIRRRILDECHSELLRRGVFYYDELEELAGYPERRGHTAAEHMDHDDFREAVEWAAGHPGEWPEPPLLAGIQPDQNMDEENASDSGIEL